MMTTKYIFRTVTRQGGISGSFPTEVPWNGKISSGSRLSFFLAIFWLELLRRCLFYDKSVPISNGHDFGTTSKLWCYG